MNPSQAAKVKWLNPEYRKHMSEVHKWQKGENHPFFGKRHSAESNKKNSEAHKGLQVGKNHPMFGRKHSEKTRKQMSESHKGIPLSEKHRTNLGIASKRAWAAKTGAERERWKTNISIGEKGKFVSEETNQKNSEAKKRAWQDPAYARKCLVFTSPNKAELKLMKILNSMYPNEWKFVGDGQMVIAGKCPDFINVNGQKKIIELYGERWHQNDNPQERIATFKPFGYETLIIWARELQGLKKLKIKLEEFCRGGSDLSAKRKEAPDGW